MEALSVKDHRNNLAASNQIYALSSVGKDDLIMNPELQARILEVEKECREGKCVSCNTKEDITRYLNAL